MYYRRQDGLDGDVHSSLKGEGLDQLTQSQLYLPLLPQEVSAFLPSEKATCVKGGRKRERVAINSIIQSSVVCYEKKSVNC